jgi:hypothetical protein
MWENLTDRDAYGSPHTQLLSPVGGSGVPLFFGAGMKFSVEAQHKGPDPVMEMVTCLQHSRTTTQMQHWKTASRSDHQALNFFYDTLPPLLDDFVESFQGKYGLLTDYILDYKLSDQEPLAYMKALAFQVESLSQSEDFPQDSWIQNQIQEMLKVIYQTVYQLRELK